MERPLSEQLTHAARDLVGLVLEDNPQRLHHCGGVAASAQALAVTVPLSAADTLVASAWLHDIGYGSQLRDSGFHPLDGAVYLRREGWPAPVCDLVAHHSGSRFVARIRGLDDRLREFEFAEDALACSMLGDGGIAWNCFRDSTWTHSAAQGGRCPSCGKETTAPPCEALSDWHDPTSPWWQQEEVSDDRPA